MAGAQAVGPSSTAFPDTLAGSETREYTSQDSNQVLIWDASIPGGSLTHCTTTLAPCSYVTDCLYQHIGSSEDWDIAYLALDLLVEITELCT